MLAKAFEKNGPVITLGSPKDLLRPVGAARAYLSHQSDRWMTVVKDLLSTAQLYVAIFDFTDSLEWELRYVHNNWLLHKLVVIFPWWLLPENEQQRWIASYAEARNRLTFLPPFKKSILGVWYEGTSKYTLITSNEGADASYQHLEHVIVFLRRKLS